MTDHDEIAQAAARFYEALNAMLDGDVRPMVAVWSHADDVTYMGPGGGFQVGWKDVLADWERQAAMKLGGRVAPEALRITASPDLAVTHGYEKGENTNTRGKPGAVSIRATNLFRREGGTWKMIGHHTDTLPFLTPDED